MHPRNKKTNTKNKGRIQKGKVIFFAVAFLFILVTPVSIILAETRTPTINEMTVAQEKGFAQQQNASFDALATAQNLFNSTKNKTLILIADIKDGAINVFGAFRSMGKKVQNAGSRIVFYAGKSADGLSSVVRGANIAKGATDSVSFVAQGAKNGAERAWKASQSMGQAFSVLSKSVIAKTGAFTSDFAYSAKSAGKGAGSGLGFVAGGAKNNFARFGAGFGQGPKVMVVSMGQIVSDYSRGTIKTLDGVGATLGKMSQAIPVMAEDMGRFVYQFGASTSFLGDGVYAGAESTVKGTIVIGSGIARASVATFNSAQNAEMALENLRGLVTVPTDILPRLATGAKNINNSLGAAKNAIPSIAGKVAATVGNIPGAAKNLTIKIGNDFVAMGQSASRVPGAAVQQGKQIIILAQNTIKNSAESTGQLFVSIKTKASSATTDIFDKRNRVQSVKHGDDGAVSSVKKTSRMLALADTAKEVAQEVPQNLGDGVGAITSGMTGVIGGVSQGMSELGDIVENIPSAIGNQAADFGKSVAEFGKSIPEKTEVFTQDSAQSLQEIFVESPQTVGRASWQCMLSFGRGIKNLAYDIKLALQGRKIQTGSTVVFTETPAQPTQPASQPSGTVQPPQVIVREVPAKTSSILGSTTINGVLTLNGNALFKGNEVRMVAPLFLENNFNINSVFSIDAVTGNLVSAGDIKALGKLSAKDLAVTGTVDFTGATVIGLATSGGTIVNNYSNNYYSTSGGGGSTVGGQFDQLNINGTARIGSTLTVVGDMAVNGNATLGDASSDTLTINASVVSIPNGITFSGGAVSFGSGGTATSTFGGNIAVNGTGTSTFLYGATFATTGGNVGIGTASPAYLFDVNGTLRASGVIYPDKGISTSTLDAMVIGGSTPATSTFTGLTLNETGTFNGIINLGDGDNIVINSDDWDISSAGVTSNLSITTSTLDNIIIGESTPSSAYFTRTSSTLSSIYNGLFVGTTATTSIYGQTTSTFPYGITFATTGGNVGIGTVAPKTKLDVQGTVSSTIIYVNAGSATTPSYSFANDPDTGFYNNAANTVGLSLGGTQYYSLASDYFYNTGNITPFQAGTTQSITGRATDASTAVATVLNNLVALTGGKLVSIRNNSIEKAYFDYSGALNWGNGTVTSSLAVGNRGSATSTFYSDLSIINRDLLVGGTANSGWGYFGDGTATTSIRGGTAGLATSTFQGDVSIANLYLGGIEFATDNGLTDFANAPISSSATTGTFQGGALLGDGIPSAVWGCIADAQGSCYNWGLGVNTSTLYYGQALNIQGNAFVDNTLTARTAGLFGAASGATSTLTVAGTAPWLTVGNGTASSTFGGYSATATTTNPYGAIFANLGGNVGIGTASPGTKLEIGTSSISARPTASIVTINSNFGTANGGGNYESLVLSNGGTDPSTSIMAPSIMFKSATYGSASAFSTGRILSYFDTSGGSNPGFSGAILAMQYATGDNAFSTGLVLRNGNVGIGTTKPSERLTIQGGGFSVGNGYATSTMALNATSTFYSFQPNTTAGNSAFLFNTTSTMVNGNIFDWQDNSQSLLTLSASGTLRLYNQHTNSPSSTQFISRAGAGQSTDNMLSIQDNDASVLFSVNKTLTSINNPLEVAVAGDVGIAYDLEFTNPDAAYVKSQSPLYITAGDPNQNHDLTMSASGDGEVIVADNFVVFKDYVSTSGTQRGAYVDVNDTGWMTGTLIGLDVDVTGVASGTVYSALFQGGLVGIGNSTPTSTLDLTSVTSTRAVAIIRGASGQAKNMLEFRNSSDSLLAYFDQNGNFSTSGTTSTFSYGATFATAGGNVGIGTASPTNLLTIFSNGNNNALLAVGNGAATTTIFGGLAGSATSTFAGDVSIPNLYLGSLIFDTDAGIVDAMDLPISASAAAGTLEGYNFSVDGIPIMSIIAQSNGSGEARNGYVGIGTMYPSHLLTMVSSSPTLAMGTGSATTTITVGNRGVATSTFYSDLSIINRDILIGGSANSGWAYIGNGTATTSIRGGAPGSVTSTFEGDVSIANLYTGMMEFGVDSGVVGSMNMPVSASASDGSLEGYSFMVDGIPTMSIVGISNGAGETRNNYVGIGTLYPSALLTVVSSSPQIALGTGSATTTLSVGNRGAATSTFYSDLSIVNRDALIGGSANSGWLYIGDGTATTSLRGGTAGLATSTFQGDVSIGNLYVGSTEFAVDAGIVDAMDLPVSASAADGTLEGYNFLVDGQPALSIVGRSNGAGEIRNPFVGIGTMYPSALLTVVSSSPQIALGTGSATTTLSVGNRGVATSTFYSDLSIVSRDVIIGGGNGTGNTGWLWVGNGTATTSIRGGAAGLATSTFQGDVLISNLYSGLITFSDDGGLVDAMDIPVSASAATGTEEGYGFLVDGLPVASIKGTSEAQGSVWDLRLELTDNKGTATTTIRGTTGTTSTFAGNVQVNGQFAVAGNCTENGGACADIAEQYTSVDEVEAGDVVVSSLTTPSNPVSSPYNSALVEKSKSGYADNVVGVVSTNPGLTLGLGGIRIGSGGPGSAMRPNIALAGRVPVKVTDENGTIKKGDYLVTSASLPGYAMKYSASSTLSGFVNIFAMALDDWDPSVEIVSENYKTNKVTVLVKNILVQNNNFGDDLTIAEKGADIIADGEYFDFSGKALVNIKSLSSVSGSWSLSEAGEFVAKSVKAKVISLNELIVAGDKETDASGAELDPAVGNSFIKSDEHIKVIYNNRVKKNSQIFITFRDNTGGPWWISNQGDGFFEVSVPASMGYNIRFSYWIVSVEGGDSDPSKPKGYDGVTQDTTAPEITSVAAVNITDAGATINWSTSEDADSFVEFSTSTVIASPVLGAWQSQSSTLTSSHSLNLTALTPQATYYYIVKSTDAAGNVSESQEYSFTTSPLVVTLPIVPAEAEIPSSDGSTSSTPPVILSDSEESSTSTPTDPTDESS